MNRHIIFSILLSGFSITPPATSQNPQDGIWAYRLKDRDSTPTIDAQLDDVIWNKAVVIADFHQMEPVDHGIPSQKTEVRIVYDAEFLFVGIKCFDDQPENIRASQLIQGFPFWDDDRFIIILDTFDDNRNCFDFMINPNGIRFDALYGNGDDDYWIEEWDGIWQGEAKITEFGWVAELAIPFKTLAFNPDQDTWGINFFRGIARNNEGIGWRSSQRIVMPANCGSLKGLKNMKQGIGLDILPSLVISGENNQSKSFQLQPSVDLFKRIRPSLTASLTWNTDFSATEVDDRKINLTRFDLFYPEKRKFFLQDAPIFSFGRLTQNGIPFFSRRIGLSDDGYPIDLIVGFKLSGRVGRWNMGALCIRQDNYGDIAASHLFVGRASVNLFSESYLGMIATSGDPVTGEDNRLGGVDFIYRNTALKGNRMIEAGAWYQHNDRSDHTDKAFGMTIQYPNDMINWKFSFTEIGKHFNPGLGFVNRTSIRQYTGNLRYRYRLNSRWLRFIESSIWCDYITDLQGDLQTLKMIFNFLSLNSHTEDVLTFYVTPNRDRVVETFEISKGIEIPVDDYRDMRYGCALQTGGHRALKAGGFIESGSFYGGINHILSLMMEWRPSKYLFSSFLYETNHVSLPWGDFTTHLSQARICLAFNSKWSWLNLIQYDNITENMGVNSRLRWIVQPGSEFFLIFNLNWIDLKRMNIKLENSEFVFKSGYTLRF